MLQPQLAMPQAAAPVAENHTLYLNNLDDKVNANKLKAALLEICSPFGEIHDIICMKSLVRKGQAWVIYKDVNSAREALSSLQSFPLFNKPMRLQYARTKSDEISKADGTYLPRPKKKLKEDPATREAKRLKAATDAQQQQDQVQQQQQVQHMWQQPVQQVQQPAPQYPNPTLFVQNLPGDATEELLRRLFMGYQGFKNVRFIEVKHCAFVDFQGEPFATSALRVLQNLEIAPGQKLDIAYARG